MENKRIIGIDIIRGISILWIITYHVWVYSGSPNIGILTTLVAYGGEVGVTLFFIISGFSVYLSIQRQKSNDLGYTSYLKKRLLRICPAYYISLIILLLFQNLSYFFTSNGLLDFVFHSVFIHNFFIQFHGTINGVYWTLGNILQFYLISWLIYKLLKKFNIIVVIASMIIVISYKYLAYNFIDNKGFEGVYYFIYGRQLLGTLDNFIFGMFIAHLFNNKKNIFLRYKYFLLFILTIII